MFRLGLALSLAIHGLVFLILWYSNQKEPEVYHVASVELLGVEDHQQAPQKERKKKNTPPPPPENKKEKNLKVSPPKPEEEFSDGQDSVNAREIKAGQQGDPRMKAVATYAQELQHFIESNRYYPRRAQILEQTGTVKVRLTIARDGTFQNVELIETSEFEILNQAAKDLVTQLRSFKPLPPSYQGNGRFVIPIRYQIQGRRF